MVRRRAEGGDELGADALDGAEPERIDGGEPLGEAPVAELDVGPQREVIGIRVRLRRAVHQQPGGVAEDGLGGYAPDLLEQLARIVRLVGEQLADLDASLEDEVFSRGHDGRAPDDADG